MHPILKLAVDNKAVPKRFEVKASADEATIYLYDVIVSDEETAKWLGGVAPETFIKALKSIAAPTIHLRINSPGGDVFAARSIAQAIAEHGANIIAHIDGYAASAATLVAVSAREVVMAKGAFFMIHNSWSLAYGNSQDMLDMAELLEKVDSTIAETYVTRTGKDIDQVRAWMTDETWFKADEAVEAGFANRVADEATAQAAWNLAVYAHAPAPAAVAASPSVPASSPAIAAHTDHLRRALETRIGASRPKAA